MIKLGVLGIYIMVVRVYMILSQYIVSEKPCLSLYSLFITYLRLITITFKHSLLLNYLTSARCIELRKIYKVIH